MALGHFYFSLKEIIMAKRRRIGMVKASHLKKGGRKRGRKSRGKKSAIK
jgi:hypothetical protein